MKPIIHCMVCREEVMRYVGERDDGTVPNWLMRKDWTLPDGSPPAPGPIKLSCKCGPVETTWRLEKPNYDGKMNPPAGA